MDNQISDITALQNLTSLEYLYLTGNQISDVSALENLTNLYLLDLANNQISDISSLVANSGIDSGDTVSLVDNHLNADSLFVHIPALEGRGVTVHFGTTVTFPDPNLEAVIREAIGKPTGFIFTSDLIMITELDGFNKDITDLTGLEHCTFLTALSLNENQITDITPLQNLTNLTRLELNYNLISDISSLQNLTNLTSLRLGRNQIEDITPLQNLTGL